MSTPKLTDERLRRHVESSRMRERLCVGLLALDKRFSRVRIRSEKGGPDQGRDLEAFLDESRLAFGAVGFVDDANDSRDQRSQIGGKFRKDLTSALKHQPELEAFLFFTNVSLTPRQLDGLRDFGRSLKPSLQVEIFTREQMRAELDRPKGFALRYQFLGIDLSPSPNFSQGVTRRSFPTA